MLPPRITTARLSLPVWTADDVAAIRSGDRLPGWHPDFPREDDGDAASMWSEADPWSSRSVVYAGLVAGSIGFYGPPSGETPEVEVGYGLIEPARGRGLMTEALSALVAAVDLEGVRVRASVEPTNAASLRVLAKCGFTELRGASEDGELVMVRPLR